MVHVRSLRSAADRGRTAKRERARNPVGCFMSPVITTPNQPAKVRDGSAKATMGSTFSLQMESELAKFCCQRIAPISASEAKREIGFSWLQVKASMPFIQRLSVHT